MIALLSPAKTLDFDRTPATGKFSRPSLADDASVLVERLSGLSQQEIADLMGVNDEIAALNVRRFKSWGPHDSLDYGLQAVFAYAGEVYRGFDVARLSAQDLYYAQNHLRILSGLYGVVRPLDVIRPYRLEMGTKLSTDRGEDLYEFWGARPTDVLNEAISGHRKHVFVNLASTEYFRVVREDALDGTVVTPVFKEKRNGDYQIVAVYAKNARGRMARFMIENRIEEAEGLTTFSEDGYAFAPDLSGERELVFTR